jgi:formate dehydrogenase
VVEALSKPLGIVPSSLPALRLLGRLGIRFSPQRLLDGLLRVGPEGDLFGLRRRGLSLRALRRRPHGVVVAEHVATGVLRSKIRHRGRRLRLAPEAIVGELRRLEATASTAPDGAFPLRLIGMRELRSHNSWMHNAPLLMRGGRTHAVRVHPDDAAAHGLADGGMARIESRHGALEVAVKVTDEMTPGTVALPHGWGHRGGWRLANANAGANYNLLTSAEPEDLEPLAGMTFLNGIAVRLEPVAPSRDQPAPEGALAGA